MSKPGAFLPEGNATSVEFKPMSVDGQDMEIKLPVGALSSLFPGQLGDLQLVMALDTSQGGGGAKKLPSGTGNSLEDGVGQLLIELQLPGGVANVSGLAEPIALTLPTAFDDSLTCAFWDEKAKRWSTEGVRVNPNSEPGGPLWCDTFHLSLFGAILKGIVSTLLCANFEMLTSKAMAELFKGDWYASIASILMWLLLTGLGACFIGAAHTDRKRQRQFHFRDEFFLVERRPAPSPEEAVEEGHAAGPVNKEASEGSVPSKEQVEKAEKVGILTGCAACGVCLGSSDAFKEALDDIISSWCESFSQIREVLESLCEGLSCVSGEEAFILVMARHLSSHMLHLSAARLASWSTGLTNNVVSFVLDDQDFCAYLMDEHNQRAEEARNKPKQRKGSKSSSSDVPHVASRNGEWKACQTAREFWKMLYDEVGHYVLHQTTHTGNNFFKSVGLMLLSNNPFAELFFFDVFISCKQRVLAFCVDLMGALALSCMFFQASGMVRGKVRTNLADCGGEEDGHFGVKIGRFIVIALGSLFVAGGPVIILESLQTKGLTWIDGPPGSEPWQKQLKKWRIQERIFWVFGTSYLAFATFFILTFLANIGDEDVNDWFTAGWMTLLQDLIVVPVAMSLVIPGVTRSILWGYTKSAGVDRQHAVRHAREQLYNKSNLLLPIVQT